MRQLNNNEKARKQNCNQNKSKMTKEEIIKQNSKTKTDLKAKTDSESRTKIIQLLPKITNFMKDL